MNRPFFTIVTPVYEGEAFLPGCCASVAAQTLADYEHLLVEDGCPRGSAALCDALAEADARVRAIHQQNGGITSARNTGIRQATGHWLLFLDQDDRLSPYFLQALQTALQTAGSDLVSWRFTNQTAQLAPDAAPPLTHWKKSQMDQLYNTGSFHYVWTKAFCLDFVHSKNLLFDQTIQDGTDDLPFVNAYCHAWFTAHPEAGVCFLDRPYYYYETGNAASVSNRLQPYQPSHLAMFGQLLSDMRQLYGCPPAGLGLVYYLCLHTLAYGVYSTPAHQRAGLRQSLLAHPALKTILAEIKACRFFSPFYLPFLIQSPELIHWVMASYQGNKRWYWRAYHLGDLLLGRHWKKI